MDQARSYQKRLGRYELVSRIATGGMAEVWLARAKGVEGFQKTVVVKTILPHLADDPEFVKMFINEALLAAALDHPNIVQIFDLGSIDDAYFIAMEHIAGRTLRQLHRAVTKQSSLLPLWVTAKIAIAICDALEHAHEKVDEEGQPLGIVHRDITPENVMVSFAGVTKVLDFGIAKASSAAVVTRGGRLKGKYAYLSPEQISAAAKGEASPVDGRADLYSLGVMLYELLTGRRPFVGDNELALLRSILRDTPRPVAEVNPQVPKNFCRIVDRATARKLDLRYARAADFRIDLEGVLEELGAVKSERHIAELMGRVFGVDRGSTSGTRASLASSSHVRTRPTEEVSVDVPPSGAEAMPESVTIELSDIIETEGLSVATEAYGAGHGHELPRSQDPADGAAAPPLPVPNAGSAPESPAPSLPDQDDLGPPEGTSSGAEDVELVEISTGISGDLDLGELSSGSGEGAPEIDLSSGSGEAVPEIDLSTGSGEGAPEIDLSTGSGEGASQVDLSSAGSVDMVGFEDIPDEESRPSSWDIILEKARPSTLPSRSPFATETPPHGSEVTPGGRHMWDTFLDRRASTLPEGPSEEGARARGEPSGEALSASEQPGGPQGEGQSFGEADLGRGASASGHSWDVAVSRVRAGDLPSTDGARGGGGLGARAGAVAEFDRGLELLSEGKQGEALEAWERALSLAPEDRKYQNNVRRLRQKLEEESSDS